MTEGLHSTPSEGAVPMNKIRLVIVTGLSGAGKTQAIKSLEDLGFFCVDNLPPALLGKMAELGSGTGGKIVRMAFGIDLRGGEFFGSTVDALARLELAGYPYQILFLEAADDTLVRRFKETRRPHPLAPEGRILEGIRRERQLLQELRGKATHIIDTTDLSPRKLREEVQRLITDDGEKPPIIVNIVSFGFKYGLPMDADLVFDVRFMPNPHYVEGLRGLTGSNAEVSQYVFRWPAARRFMKEITRLLEFLLPQYVSEGKSQLVIAIGCTGGRHRSVAVTEALAQTLRSKGYTVATEHRDAAKNLEESVEQ